jgi:hypothetical protein
MSKSSTGEAEGQDRKEPTDQVIAGKIPDSRKTITYRYYEEHGQTFCERIGRKGEKTVCLLANFTARIVEQIERHEAGVVSLFYKIVGTRPDEIRDVTIPAGDFTRLVWVQVLGSGFIIEPGRATKDMFLHAIQYLSECDRTPRVVEHASLGWIKHNEKHIYLHANGAIDKYGPCDDVRVGIHGVLNRYGLPDPPTTPDDVRAAIRDHLAIWELAQADLPGSQAAAAVVATLPFRAVLSPFNSMPHFGGPTGTFKTSISRLALQHFALIQGPDSSMPVDWYTTPNSIQRFLFDCRDSLLVIDDLKSDKSADTAELIAQAQGNLKGRERMNPDGTLQPSLDPGGSILSTGEIDPVTRSSLGRVLLVELSAGDIDTRILSRLQKLGDSGSFARAMSAYVRDLASNIDSVRVDHKRRSDEIREAQEDFQGAHQRHPYAVAELIAAYKLFLDFAVKADATTEQAAAKYLENCRRILVDLGKAQSGPQDEAKIGRLFIEMIAEALKSSRCFLVDHHSDDSDDNVPECPNLCGWRVDPLYEEGHQHNKWQKPKNVPCIGQVDVLANTIYLFKRESESIVQQMFRTLKMDHSLKNIGRELLHENLCRSFKEKKLNGSITNRADNKIPTENGRQRVYHIPIQHIFGEYWQPNEAKLAPLAPLWNSEVGPAERLKQFL